jgi:hypothetical protein
MSKISGFSAGISATAKPSPGACFRCVQTAVPVFANASERVFLDSKTGGVDVATANGLVRFDARRRQSMLGS